MTEKRFRPVCCVTDWYIEDKKISPFAVLTPHQASDLLNEQHEIITEQAIQIDFLNSENKHMREVLEENKRLKQSLTDVMECVLQNDFYRDIMKEALKELKDELEIEEMI